jgi:O-antigen ligase
VLKQNRLVIGTGLLFLLLSLGHIPVKIFPHAFDKNAPVHFLILCLISVLFGIYILINHKKFEFSGKGPLLITSLVIAILVSTHFSVDFYGSLIGEAGRYTGAISLFCLLVVAIFHSQFSDSQIRKLVLIYCFTIFTVSTLGILQHFKIIDLPGDSGITSTLGNLDFFAAYVATSLPLLLYLGLNSSRKFKALLIIFTISELYALHLAGPLQGFVDIGIIVIALLIFRFRSFIPRFDSTLNVKSAVGTFALIIWLEGIFLMPFIGNFIPVLGNDVQVRIRGQFWLAATNQFLSKPLFGVGPDQYGNYYESFRTLDSVKEYPLILSNDAHSSTVQTLATLGILGSIAFALLLGLLVRSILIIDQRKLMNRKLLAILGLYLFVYLTNATVSPITLPNKFLFWAIAGYLVGLAYRSGSSEIKLSSFNKFSVPILVSILMVINLFIAVNHVGAQITFMKNWEKFAKNQSSKIDIKYNKYLSCTMFYDNIAMMINNQGNQALEDLSNSQVKANPRCVDAQINLAKLNYNKGNLAGMKLNVYELTRIAPNRDEVLALAAVYAAKSGDKELAVKVNKQYQKLGKVPLIAP